MEPTTPTIDGGSERTTANGQPIVADGRSQWEAEQADTTAKPHADDADTDTVSSLIDGEAQADTKTTALDQYSQAVAHPMPNLPADVTTQLADSDARAKKQAMALTNHEAVAGIPGWMARRHGETLSQWEERVSQRADGITATGGHAAGNEATGNDREQASRDAVAEMCVRQRQGSDGSPHLAEISQDDRQRVIQEATRLADKYAAVSERLAVKILARFVNLYGILDGVPKARSHLLSDVTTTLADIEVDEADTTDAVAEITHLKPKDDRHDGKAVAASIQGDDGDNGHLTIWYNSIKGDYDTVDSLWLSTSWNGDAAEIETTDLNVGDRIRVRDASVSEYKGEPSLALTDDSTLEVIEKGDGPSVGNTAEYNGEHSQNPTRCTGSGASIGGGVTTDTTEEADADGETTTTANPDTTEGQANLTEFTA